MYGADMGDWFEGYDQRQVRDRLAPYLEYIGKVEKYYREHPLAVIEYKIIDSPGAESGRDVWMDLGGVAVNPGADRAGEHAARRREEPPGPGAGSLDPQLVQQIMDPEKTRQVHEYGEGRPRSIRIVDRDAERMRILLERRPGTKKVQILHDTYSLFRQKEAVRSLLYRPEPRHETLIKLFHDRDRIKLGAVRREKIEKWFLLDGDRDGAALQREFVEKALGTPDFAFLEGPPGSGKTTVLCELVLQLVSRRKRVLFCASTHVAVDNLLEKLDGTISTAESDLIPLRIGESDKISVAAGKYRYKDVIETWTKRLSGRLSKLPNPNDAQKSLMAVLRRGDTMGQIARDCANLVCGTTIGILQHPDIRGRAFSGLFDVMILDEASKTTFQEFLVPAMHAGRWIIAGDTRQLAPHTEQAEIALHVDKCVDGRLGQACHDAFTVSRRRGSAVVVAADGALKEMYRAQCEKLGVKFVDADGGERWDGEVTATGGRIVAGSARSLAGVGAKKLADIAGMSNVTVRGLGDIRGILEERAQNRDLEPFRDGSAAGRTPDSQDGQAWGSAVGWRVGTLPLDERNLTGREEAIKNGVEDLMPAGDTDYDNVKKRLEAVRSMALPSILQLLQHGHGTGGKETVMTRGIPREDFGRRHVLLEYQYRMHPEIAAFAGKHVYGGAALKTPEAMGPARKGRYGRYGGRLVWIDVPGGGRAYANEKEAALIAGEIRAFWEWARKNPRRDGRPWEVAVLAFYTRQVDAIRTRLVRLTGGRGPHSFRMPSDGGREAPAATVELRTLDSFQGHEADVVFLSVARSWPTAFLENPNRVNVAVTRARYQQVVVGNRGAMARSDSLLGTLAGEARVEEAGDG